jgi:hypothetical protein
MLTKTGTKLLDFGLAKPAGACVTAADGSSTAATHEHRTGNDPSGPALRRIPKTAGRPPGISDVSSNGCATTLQRCTTPVRPGGSSRVPGASDGLRPGLCSCSHRSRAPGRFSSRDEADPQYPRPSTVQFDVPAPSNAGIPLGRTAAHPLAGTRGARSAFFLPDGRWLAYFSSTIARISGTVSVPLPPRFRRRSSATFAGFVLSISQRRRCENCSRVSLGESNTGLSCT